MLVIYHRQFLGPRDLNNCNLINSTITDIKLSLQVHCAKSWPIASPSSPPPSSSQFCKQLQSYHIISPASMHQQHACTDDIKPSLYLWLSVQWCRRLATTQHNSKGNPPPCSSLLSFQDTALTNFLGNLKSEQLSCLNLVSDWYKIWLSLKTFYKSFQKLT